MLRTALVIGALSLPNALSAAEFSINPTPFEGVWSTNSECNGFFYEFDVGITKVFDAGSVSDHSRISQFRLEGRSFFVFYQNSARNPNLYDTIIKYKVLRSNTLEDMSLQTIKNGQVVKQQEMIGKLYKCEKGWLGFRWKRAE